MERDIMQKIKQFAIKECQNAFGYCSVADSENIIIINSGNEEDLKITIKLVNKGEMKDGR